MPISKNESGIMKAVLGLHEAASSNDISSELGISQENISRAITALAKKGLLERENGTVVLAKTPQAERFREMYFAHPVSPFEKIIADKRVLLLSKIGERQKSIKELSRESQIPISTVHYYLMDLVRLGVVSKQKKGKEGVYRFNYVLWRPLKEFVDILSDFEETLKVPQGGLLIKSYENEVLFKSRWEMDATPTAFSVYGEFGIDLRLREGYYVLPKRELSTGDVFIHSLDSAKDVSQKLYCILFYLKYKGELKGVRHPMLRKIRAVLIKENRRGFPSYEEVMERVELYAIEH